MNLNPPMYGRRDAFDKVLTHLLKLDQPRILEVGTTRIYGNWEGDGYSTPMFAYAALLRGGEVWSIDIDPEAISVANRVLAEGNLAGPSIHVVQADALEYLKGWDKPLDVFYLDAWHPLRPEEKAAERHLECMKMVEWSMKLGSLVGIDDMHQHNPPYGGKGELVIPYLLENGWEVVHPAYCFFLQKVW